MILTLTDPKMNSNINESIQLPALEDIIERDPLTVNPDLLVVDAIALMSQARGQNVPVKNTEPNVNIAAHKSSSYVVAVEARQLIGVFTERDVVKLIAQGSDLSELKISQVISQPALALQESETSDTFTALSIMRQHQIRHLPVVSNEAQLIGIITHSSIRRVLDPSAVLKMRYVSEIMTSQVIQSPGDVSLLSLAKLMSIERVSCVVIVENQTREDIRSLTIPVGIITERDLVQFQVLEVDLKKIQARDVMSTPLFCLSPSDSLWQAHQLMRSKRVRRLVVAQQKGELAGIVTQTSILSSFDPLEMSKVINLLQFQVDKQTIELRQIHQQLENQLQMTRSRLRHLLLSSPAIIYSRQITDDLLALSFVSENVSSMLGYQSSEFLSDPLFWSERIHSEERPGVLNELSQLFENGEGASEYRFCHQNGNYRWLRDEFKLVRDATGKPIELVGYWIDITEKKQIESQLFHTQRLESLGALASGVAHDFNNILTPILATAQLLPLKFPHLDQQTRELLEVLEDSSRRGAELVQQILSFARKAEGKLINLQLAHLLLEVVRIAKTSFPKSIEICRELPSSRILWHVLGDPTQVHQVLMNLCVNARDAMPHGGTLTIGVENVFVDENYARLNTQAQVGPYVVVTIRDTGVGMSEEIKSRIFEPFFTTKEANQGTGLGLSTALSIIKNHRGFVHVYSEVGKGTQFKVYLPAVEVKATQVETNLKLFSGNGELILIVDDEATIRQIAQVFLENYNYRTLMASDGMEAIELYTKHHQEIDVVLMDMMMPSMDGLTAIPALQEINPQVKIIATSGIPSKSQLDSLAGVGIKDFLSKPYTITELLDILHKLIRATN